VKPKYFTILVGVGIGLIVIGGILCPPSFWDSLFVPSGFEPPIFDVALLNYVGFGLTLAGLVLTLAMLLGRRQHLKDSILPYKE